MNLEYRSIRGTVNTEEYLEPGIMEYNRNQEYRSILGAWNTGVYWEPGIQKKYREQGI